MVAGTQSGEFAAIELVIRQNDLSANFVVRCTNGGRAVAMMRFGFGWMLRIVVLLVELVSREQVGADGGRAMVALRGVEEGSWVARRGISTQSFSSSRGFRRRTEQLVLSIRKWVWRNFEGLRCQ